MAKVIDVTDVPELPGAGMLHFDDGRPPLMALPEIAGHYREQLGQPDERLAANDKPPGETRTDAGSWAERHPVISAAANFAAEHPVITHLASGPALGIATGLLRPDAPPPTPAAPAAAPSQPAPPAPGGTPYGPPPPPAQPEPAPQDAVQQARDVVAQRAAAELIRGTTGGGPARPAGYAPVSQRTTVEAGPAYDPQAARDRLAADQSVLDAQLGQQATAKQIADAQAAKAAADNLAARQHLAAQQAEIQRKQQAYQQQNQHMERELADYSQSAQPDPNRFFSRREPIANIMSVIGQALGAAGASLGHSQNFAFEYVQQQIRNDIAAQQQAYEAGRADRNNALARFANYYHGDIDMAKAGLQQAMNKVAETEVSQFAAQAQSRTISSNAAALAAQFQKDSLMREQQKAELALGKTTTATEDKFHQAEGGGPRPLTPAEQEARLKLLGKPGKDQGALGLTPQALARQKATYGTKKEQIARLYSALEEEAKLQGVAIDKATGTVIDPKTGRPATELPKSPGIGYVAGHLPDSLAGEEGRALRRARANSARLHAQTIYDKSNTAEEAEHEIPTVMGKTPGDALRSLKQRLHELSQYDYQLDSTAATIDPRMVNERTRAQKDVNVSRATGEPLEGPRPTPSENIVGAPEPDTDTGDGP